MEKKNLLQVTYSHKSIGLFQISNNRYNNNNNQQKHKF